MCGAVRSSPSRLPRPVPNDAVEGGRLYDQRTPPASRIVWFKLAGYSRPGPNRTCRGRLSQRCHQRWISRTDPRSPCRLTTQLAAGPGRSGGLIGSLIRPATSAASSRLPFLLPLRRRPPPTVSTLHRRTSCRVRHPLPRHAAGNHSIGAASRPLLPVSASIPAQCLRRIAEGSCAEVRRKDASRRRPHCRLQARRTGAAAGSDGYRNGAAALRQVQLADGSRLLVGFSPSCAPR